MKRRITLSAILLPLACAAAVAEPDGGHLLQPIKDAPLVQMLVPGFTVKELPLDLTNINNVKYRADGKLFALAYNGNVWLLSDTDGDGLEDKAELFWKNDGTILTPIGMAVTPPGYPHGDGVAFASKNEVALVVDTDSDDRADKKITVAKGWKPTLHQVDALGVAFDKDGSIYFGLGTEWFADAYLVDKETGKAKYDVNAERGTIQKVSPDFSKRETVCTGIRFSVALAFNREGDLFATDQEGATWLPNGNPFDELLHIQPGRHYGFPPKHPVHLPEVPGGVDEPSVFDYGPQHQSACGLNFNDGVNGGPVFGPEWWRGDAIVCGQSRGKIYRTQLVKTAAGYVAKNQTLACLNMLTTDACPTPDGSLVVACHSGAPDWGSGPEGKGKLFKIVYADKNHPQPVLTWPTNEREVRIAFDRPLREQDLRGLNAAGVKIEYGDYVRAGDRFEAMFPGYAVVETQRATPRFELRVHSVQVSPDRQTLILATDPHPRATHYAVSLPSPTSRELQEAFPGGLPQHPSLDLDYDLSGVAVSTTAPDGGEKIDGWMPHVDFDVSHAFTPYSAEHDRLWRAFDSGGPLRMEALFDHRNLLRPAVQPGSMIDFEYPQEVTTLHLTTLDLGGGVEEYHGVNVKPNSNTVSVKVEWVKGDAQYLATYSTAEDRRERAYPLRRVVLPWAKLDAPNAGDAPARLIPEIEGGDWLRGREVFFSEQAVCSRCHVYNGKGGKIGPDLSNLIHRDYASVLRDIEEPGAALNPEHIAYQVTLTDGRVLIGVPRSGEEGQTILGDAAGVETVLGKDEIKSMDPLPISVMPAALNKAMGEDKFRDLMTFLLTKPPIGADAAP